MTGPNHPVVPERTAVAGCACSRSRLVLVDGRSLGGPTEPGLARVERRDHPPREIRGRRLEPPDGGSRQAFAVARRRNAYAFRYTMGQDDLVGPARAPRHPRGAFSFPAAGMRAVQPGRSTVHHKKAVTFASRACFPAMSAISTVPVSTACTAPFIANSPHPVANGFRSGWRAIIPVSFVAYQLCCVAGSLCSRPHSCVRGRQQPACVDTNIIVP